MHGGNKYETDQVRVLPDCYIEEIYENCHCKEGAVLMRGES